MSEEVLRNIESILKQKLLHFPSFKIIHVMTVVLHQAQ